MFKELQLAIIESYCDFACSTCVPRAVRLPNQNWKV